MKWEAARYQPPISFTGTRNYLIGMLFKFGCNQILLILWKTIYDLNWSNYINV